MPSWPGTLPASPLFDGNGVAMGDNSIRFKPDMGRAITRRRYTTRDDTVTFTFRMTRTQLALFETFYKTDLGDGNLEFTYADPTINATRTYKFERPPTYNYVRPFYVEVNCVWTRIGT